MKYFETVGRRRGSNYLVPASWPGARGCGPGGQAPSEGNLGIIAAGEGWGCSVTCQLPGAQGVSVKRRVWGKVFEEKHQVSQLKATPVCGILGTWFFSPGSCKTHLCFLSGVFCLWGTRAGGILWLIKADNNFGETVICCLSC